MRILWGKRTIVIQELNFLYLVSLSSSTCDFYGHYGKGGENRGFHMGLEVALVIFAHTPWAESQFHGPTVVAKLAWRCRENVHSRGTVDGFGEHRFTPCFSNHKIIVKNEYHQAASSIRHDSLWLVSPIEPVSPITHFYDKIR